MADEMEREGGDITAEHMVEPVEGPSDIQRFFTGSKVFITGATGFVGQLLLEKLLRSCPSISRIYVLMRPKKGKTVEKRFDEIFNSVIYERLHHDQPRFIEKVVIVSGDVTQPKFGLNQEVFDKVVQEVDVIFHAAATVRFDEPLRTAVDINVKGTKEVIKLAKEIKNIRAVVHISTAYANCVKKVIDEVFYDIPITVEKLISIVDLLNDQQLEAITPMLLGQWPNTYTFTKAVAENIVKEYAKGLPITIVRPSIVISTAKEPVAGWINNYYGPIGLTVGAAMGVLRTFYADPTNICDIVPADLCVNAIIAAAWNIGNIKGDNLNIEKTTEPQFEEEIVPIYNYISSNQNPIHWHEYMRFFEIHAKKIPSPLIIWHYSFKLTPSYANHIVTVYLLHYFPALIIDAVFLVLGKKPMAMKIYRKVEKVSDVTAYFSLRQWKFHNDHTRQLYDKLTATDKRLFNFDLKKLNWFDYFGYYTRGMRVYLLKDPMDTVPQGKVRSYKLMFAHYFIVTLFFLGLLKLMMMIYFYMFDF